MRALPAPPAYRLFHASLTAEALDLLDAAGVRTFVDLAEWDAARLQHRLAQVNASARRVGDVPPVAAVAAWIAHARRSARAADRPTQAPTALARWRRLYARLAARQVTGAGSRAARRTA